MSAAISQPAVRSGQPGRFAAAALAGLVALTGAGIVASQVVDQARSVPVPPAGYESRTRPLYEAPEDKIRIQPAPRIYPGQIPSVIDTGTKIYPGQIPSVIDTGTKVVIPEAPASMTPAVPRTLPGRPGAR